MNSKQKEYLAIRSEVRLPFKQSAGKYLSRFLLELRENGRIVANRCPECGRINLPPNITCGWCKIAVEDKAENWLELPDQGTVVTFLEITQRDIEPLTGQVLGKTNPGAQILLEGTETSRCTPLYHILEETDMKKIYNGMRVQAVWKSREERVGNLSDIVYFRTLMDKERAEQ